MLITIIDRLVGYQAALGGLDVRQIVIKYVGFDKDWAVDGM